MALRAALGLVLLTATWADACGYLLGQWLYEEMSKPKPKPEPKFAPTVSPAGDWYSVCVLECLDGSRHVGAAHTSYRPTEFDEPCVYLFTLGEDELREACPGLAALAVKCGPCTLWAGRVAAPPPSMRPARGYWESECVLVCPNGAIRQGKAITRILPTAEDKPCVFIRATRRDEALKACPGVDPETVTCGECTPWIGPEPSPPKTEGWPPNTPMPQPR
jgi:hypothetical protein